MTLYLDAEKLSLLARRRALQFDSLVELIAKVEAVFLNELIKDLPKDGILCILFDQTFVCGEVTAEGIEGIHMGFSFCINSEPN